MDSTDLTKAKELIEGSEAVMVLGHQYPDGDAIGAVQGLAIMLTNAGHRVQASWPEPFEPPHKYGFLPGAGLLVEPQELKQEGVTVTLDCSNAERLEELKVLALDSPGLLNIDHHPDNTRFGSVNLVDPKASATTEIIYRHCGALGLAVDLDAAFNLYTGIVTDTGRFQFANTTSETLEAASEIVAMGVNPNSIYANVYQSDSLEYIRLTGEVLTRAVYDESLGLIHGCVMQDDLKAFGVQLNETEDLIDDLRALKGHVVAALFKELTDGKIRVSLRSREECDIGTIARKLGGGGHRVAAGYTSKKNSLEEALEELKEELIVSGRDTGCG